MLTSNKSGCIRPFELLSKIGGKVCLPKTVDCIEEDAVVVDVDEGSDPRIGGSEDEDEQLEEVVGGEEVEEASANCVEVDTEVGLTEDEATAAAEAAAAAAAMAAWC